VVFSKTAGINRDITRRENQSEAIVGIRRYHSSDDSCPYDSQVTDWRIKITRAKDIYVIEV